MKIAQISFPRASTPPAKYGGTEAVVSYLTEELVALGHEVTLFARGDSVTKARLWSSGDSLISHTFRLPRDPLTTETLCAIRLAETWEYISQSESEFDIIHNHANTLYISNLIHTPIITTTHLSTEHYRLLPEAHRYVSISQSQQKLEPGLNWVGHVYNGIRVEDFPFEAIKDDYLLFIGAIVPWKCPHIAIQVARALGIHLKIAGPIFNTDYYGKIAPLIDGHLIEYVGEADFAQKTALYKNASALLFPMDWEEPFGLVAIEALACGTPVIAYARGALPEIIVNGQVGFLVKNVEEMTSSVEKVKNISPWACRSYVEKNFDARIMASRYIDVYKNVIALG